MLFRFIIHFVAIFVVIYTPLVFPDKPKKGGSIQNAHKYQSSHTSQKVKNNNEENKDTSHELKRNISKLIKWKNMLGALPKTREYRNLPSYMFPPDQKPTLQPFRVKTLEKNITHTALVYQNRAFFAYEKKLDLESSKEHESSSSSTTTAYPPEGVEYAEGIEDDMQVPFFVDGE